MPEYVKEDVEPGKKIQYRHHPYANDPSFATRFLELICFLIILDSGVLWMSGTMAIILSSYLLALGILGLFAWTRRHIVLWSFFGFSILIGLIVCIALDARDDARKLPYVENYGSKEDSKSIFTGSKKVSYATAIIAIFFIALGILASFRIVIENRHRKRIRKIVKQPSPSSSAPTRRSLEIKG
eukprot:TRINITY_DN1028_c0_g1_i3.p1 TRINITY_DN1028_c0_g1~~TRINITY_DN1028_c0_g1_i3.p1  ORF type:complete len:184 (-),score=35.08 TRINITY_DN1028_c0_g1_i3:57-608(-)